MAFEITFTFEPLLNPFNKELVFSESITTLTEMRGLVCTIKS